MHLNSKGPADEVVWRARRLQILVDVVSRRSHLEERRPLAQILAAVEVRFGIRGEEHHIMPPTEDKSQRIDRERYTSRANKFRTWRWHCWQIIP